MSGTLIRALKTTIKPFRMMLGDPKSPVLLADECAERAAERALDQASIAAHMCIGVLS